MATRHHVGVQVSRISCKNIYLLCNSIFSLNKSVPPHNSGKLGNNLILTEKKKMPMEFEHAKMTTLETAEQTK